MLCKAYLDKIQTKKTPIFDKIQTYNMNLPHKARLFLLAED